MDYRRELMRKGSEIWQSVRDGDFEEDDVWDVLRESSKTGKPTESLLVSVPRNLRSSGARMIPRANSNNSSQGIRMIQQSAPVNIPNWKHFSKKFNEDDDYDYKMPPHEVIAKRTQIASFSVFEGVGRKLRGRDLSEIRHAVLVKTGFLESP